MIELEDGSVVGTPAEIAEHCKQKNLPLDLNKFGGEVNYCSEFTHHVPKKRSNFEVVVPDEEK